MPCSSMALMLVHSLALVASALDSMVNRLTASRALAIRPSAVIAVSNLSTMTSRSSYLRYGALCIVAIVGLPWFVCVTYTSGNITNIGIEPWYVKVYFMFFSIKYRATSK